MFQGRLSLCPTHLELLVRTRLCGAAKRLFCLRCSDSRGSNIHQSLRLSVHMPNLRTKKGISFQSLILALSPGFLVWVRVGVKTCLSLTRTSNEGSLGTRPQSFCIHSYHVDILCLLAMSAVLISPFRTLQLQILCMVSLGPRISVNAVERKGLRLVCIVQWCSDRDDSLGTDNVVGLHGCNHTLT